MIPKQYVETVYAGFIGMNIGIRLGAPIEPVAWTYERIRDVYGDIRDYVKPYTTFAADDDANGPVFFIRALYDDATDRELEPEDVGKAWLNYAREGIGMFWWGGEDISTEHRAYVNLRKGIPAPRSGSIEVNGTEMAEQIGGQIFIDSWGLLFPGQAEKAADYAEKAASVSHDGNGLYGARFMAACIAKAFDASSMDEIIAEGLRMIPDDSTYARVVHAVMDFHRGDLPISVLAASIWRTIGDTINIRGMPHYPECGRVRACPSVWRGRFCAHGRNRVDVRLGHRLQCRQRGNDPRRLQRSGGYSRTLPKADQ